MRYFKYGVYQIGTKLFTALPKRLQNASLRVCHIIEDTSEISSQKKLAKFEGRWISSVETKPANETAVVQLAVSAYHRAKDSQLRATGPYQPDGEWKDNLLRTRLHSYDDAISCGDLATVAELLRNFFRNGGIAGLWDGEDVFEGFCRLDKPGQLPRMNIMIKQYAAWRENLPLVPLKELDAPRVGNPWGYRFEGMLLYEPVFEYNYHAHFFDQLLHGLQTPVVLEIGGGFGGLAHHLLHCCPSAKYIGLDLPENILIQTYYLSSIFPDAKILTYQDSPATIDRTLLDQYDIVLLPNFELPRIANGIADLIVNVRSLSEMSGDTINEYYKQIDRIGHLYYFNENICKARPDLMIHRISNTEFPSLKNYTEIMSVESRWPKYQKKSAFYCRENLHIHRDAIRGT